MAIAAIAMLAVGPARAADPDWPCAQPLVATLTPGAYWNASPAPQEGWRDDPRLADLVAATVPRDVPAVEATARLAGFAESLAPDRRGPVLAQTFQGLVDATNAQRDRLIARIKELARRQRELGHLTTQLAAQLRDAPPDDPGNTELTQRRDFVQRAFQEAQRAMRYACEAPATLDARLGQFARVLQQRLAG